jgi:cytochrome c oxidase assembly protein subunit 11
VNSDGVQRANRRLLVKMVVVVAAMFGFGYALVPLYNVFCDITGIRFQEETGRVAETDVKPDGVDSSRWVTVEFTGNTMNGLDWEFKPVTRKMRVHPGELATAVYFARNLSEQAIVGQAVPSVTPSEATSHLKKTECFCFSQQRLEAGESKQMPVRFFVDANLPRDVRTITLSYAFFEAKQSAAIGADALPQTKTASDGRSG